MKCRKKAVTLETPGWNKSEKSEEPKSTRLLASAAVLRAAAEAEGAEGALRAPAGQERPQGPRGLLPIATPRGLQQKPKTIANRPSVWGSSPFSSHLSPVTSPEVPPESWGYDRPPSCQWFAKYHGERLTSLKISEMSLAMAELPGTGSLRRAGRLTAPTPSSEDRTPGTWIGRCFSGS